MAGEDDDLKVNTLHRFAKHSPRLVLHEYSHCEVPAGCGGVVLRWIDPIEGAPCTIQLRGEKVNCEVFLDGVEITTGMSLIRDGVRVLAVRVNSMGDLPRPFYISIHPDGEFQADHISTGTPRWLAMTTEPAATWTAPEFDDRAWSPPVEATADLIATLDEWRRRAYNTALQNGQRVFAIDTSSLWLRVAFTFVAAPRRVPRRR